MSKLINLGGQRFGRLRVLERGKTVSRSEDGSVVYWMCKCDCGEVTEVRSSDLRNGHTSSCGCRKKREATWYRTPLRLPSHAA